MDELMGLEEISQIFIDDGKSHWTLRREEIVELQDTARAAHELNELLAGYVIDNDKLKAENERIRADNMRLRLALQAVEETVDAENDRLKAENFHLQGQMLETISSSGASAFCERELRKKKESLREQLRTASANATQLAEGVLKLKEQLRTARSTLEGKSTRAYCNYIDQLKRNECLGAEYKIKSGKFSRVELEAHNKAREELGKHKAFAEAIRTLGDAEPQHPPRVMPEDTAKLQAMQEYIDGVGVRMDEMRNRLGIDPQQYPIGGYAPGNYYCLCADCKKEFIGDKRAIQCEPCALYSVSHRKENGK